MIRLVDVWYKYPYSNGWIIRGVNHVFQEGSIQVILGANGSGKTTLFKIASLIYKPIRGKIYTWGKDYWNLSSDERLIIKRRIVYVHEKPIILHGSVLYNIAYGLIIRGIDEEEAIIKAEEYLTELGFSYLVKRRPNELSMGEKQLVSILRSLIVEPQILFLDEPFAHLDIDKRELLIGLLKSLKKKGRGIIVSTHDQYIAENIADETIMMINGVLRINR
jgi:tungstate transport system ATP-binding protein